MSPIAQQIASLPAVAEPVSGPTQPTKAVLAGTALIGEQDLSALQRYRDRYKAVCALSSAQIDSLRALSSTTGKTFDEFIDDILALPGLLPGERQE